MITFPNLYVKPSSVLSAIQICSVVSGSAATADPVVPAVVAPAAVVAVPVAAVVAAPAAVAVAAAPAEAAE